MENNLTSQQALDRRNRSCASHDKCTHKRYLTAIFSPREALLTDRKNVFFILYWHNVVLYLHVLKAVRADGSLKFRVEIHRLHNVTFLMKQSCIEISIEKSELIRTHNNLIYGLISMYT